MAIENAEQKAAWLGMWKHILSFVIGVIVASFVVGSARQRMSDLATWKELTAPRIERMDAVGTLSFEHFHKEYEKTQVRQEKKIDELDKEVRELQKRIDPP